MEYPQISSILLSILGGTSRPMSWRYQYFIIIMQPRLKIFSRFYLWHQNTNKIVSAFPVILFMIYLFEVFGYFHFILSSISTSIKRVSKFLFCLVFVWGYYFRFSWLNSVAVHNVIVSWLFVAFFFLFSPASRLYYHYYDVLIIHGLNNFFKVICPSQT